MTDYLADTPQVLVILCPTCSPDVDPRTYDARRCTDHAPGTAGSEDERVACGYVNGSAEAGGEDNRRWCELLHGRAH